MRRKEKEIHDPAEIDAILERAEICHLGLSDQGETLRGAHELRVPGPGFVFSFGRLGQKNRHFDIQPPRMRRFQCVDRELVRGEKPCKWGMHFQSLMGVGTASFVEEAEQKRRALDLIMAHYTTDGFHFNYPDNALESICVIRVDIESFSGKRS